ncbi:hypothetical protein FJ872_08295 [Mesorhizobium sp. B2-5-9]|nr:hypothetical protein A9K65_030635 [Mesorhizobium sp. WSM1497]PBC13784.1 hypothetical protein CK225_24580 [Mesorhizobium loti]TPI78974.1 hypothetical protein FJ423_15460 [Mesorhizobium sp. B2-8-9]TPJ26854.1 hypothetical protein FJ425_17925 [Mesorhizobium sp. B2-7-2]TPJ39842.1 hypothetical protein FJ432_18185 [Mesorhizobium sp. B2-6-5]TPJ40446.1 hypothetical protein FJ437_26200 [Mesorhizobium sp. B2-6-6]TPJ63962.1 hypothetical protein FJ462_22900 [Mesorhizobium sp. B2-6-7]TPJ75246.1 hypothe
MKAQIQANYEERLGRYAALVHGNNPPGLVIKLATYSSLLKQCEEHGDRLWRIEPLLYQIMRSIEVDLHLATAKLLESPRRSDRSLFRFLEFCLDNQMHIAWKSGTPSPSLIKEQLNELEAHRTTIAMIMGRRDKFFAHLDKRYFSDPNAIYADYPLDESAVVALVNCVIGIISYHQRNLDGAMAFHVGEFYQIAVENIVRNLEAGRKVNFPGQLD